MFHKRLKKWLTVEGMSCKHCSKRVEDALMKLEPVHHVKVDLEKKKVVVTLTEEVPNDILISTIDEIGYQVTNIVEE